MADSSETTKLIGELEVLKGNGYSLISIYVSADDNDFSDVTSKLGYYLESASNNEKGVYGESSLGAITSAQQILKRYSNVPPNGLVIYTGIVVTDAGKKEEVTFDFEPFKPMRIRSCQLGRMFNLVALLDLVGYRDDYVLKNDQNIAIWKLKKLIKAQEEAKSSSVWISLILQPGDDIYFVTKLLGIGFGLSSYYITPHIRAIISAAQQRLKLHGRVPLNGLVMYSGTLPTADGVMKDVTIDFEPVKPIPPLRKLGYKIHIEALTELLETENKFGFIVIVGNRVLFGILSGNTKEVLHDFTYNTPMEQIGGADRAFRRYRLHRDNYEKMSEMVTDYYINPKTCKPNVLSLVVAVSPAFEINLINWLDHRLQRRLLHVVEVFDGGILGFDQAIAKSSNYLLGVRFIQEMRLLQRFMGEIARETNKYVIGVEDTLRCLELGAVKVLIVWENLDVNRYVLKNTKTRELVTRYLTNEQGTVESNFQESGTNAKLEVLEKISLPDWFAQEYKIFGCALELVSDSSREGLQFCRGLGGIGGILKYELDIQLFDDHSDDGDELEIQALDLSDDGEN